MLLKTVIHTYKIHTYKILFQNFHLANNLNKKQCIVAGSPTQNWKAPDASSIVSFLCGFYSVIHARFEAGLGALTGASTK
jgi:hypothetical protein